MHAKLSFPLKHISVRVPWHDSGWAGSVCKSPSHNTACLKLINIANRKNDAHEELLAGESLKGMEQSQFPACVTERGTFMADFAFSREHEHPYTKTSQESHAHFRPTPLRYPAYSAAGVPYRWLMKPIVFGDPKEAPIALVDQHPLEDVSQSLEPELPFKTRWMQDHRNHRSLLNCFWGYVRPEESLVFFYAKQVPLVEDIGRRVIIGVGHVKKIGELIEYVYNGSPDGKIRSLLWERMVQHSIRPEFSDGFLLPYQEALAKSEDGQNFDPAEVLAFAPEDRFTEFSFGTEHVGDDAGIEALLACRAALLRAGELFNFQSRIQEAWIDKELGRLWKKRGAYPGLGSILSATGITMGNFIAQTLAEEVGEERNPWEAWDKVLVDPAKQLPKDLANHIDDTIIKSWKKLSKQRRQFLELLSRVDLTIDQANVLAIPEVRQEEEGIDLDDQAFIKNPYLIYEAMRLTTVPVSLGAVDRGMFPTAFVREHFPIDPPTLVKTAVDARRLRALVIRELENAAIDGNTLSAQASVITELRGKEDASQEERTDVTADLLAVAEEEQFEGEISITALADGRKAYQLTRLADVGKVISELVRKRAAAKRHELKIDWRGELDDYLKEISGEAEERAKEEQARREKAAALAEIAASRFSVLIGPAGTGKTTLLSVLCRRPEIYKDGILLLAPTGKARVRMEDVARQAGTKNFEAFTLAQFLSRSDRYDGWTQRYLLTGQPGEKCARTVVVDECSMLTEEMMAALIEAISGVHRLIFVGDHRQLPPIGAGRPFVDIIANLQPDDIEDRFPRVAPGYAELTIPRRQGAGERDDLQLAAWFGGNVIAPGEDQVFEILAGKRDSDTIKFIQWETPEELEQHLPRVLAEALGFDKALDEYQAFACSLGGNLDDIGGVWFNSKFGKFEGSGKFAETWQILSPVRQKPWGVEPLNRLIQQRYRAKDLEKARARGYYRSIPPPRGDDQIIYGDKIINNRNWSVPKRRIYPEPSANGYLANGEIGIIVGHRRTRKRDWKPENLEIEFSTQQGKVFTFYKSDFSDEKEASLELAYALTVHKAQGSEFETVFLVLPKSPLMVTRELLYTALTRQKKKVIIFHQGSATDLQKLSSEKHSATATRLTNLFGPPQPVAIGDVFLEDRLIHSTDRGDAVRSKSEVIIANSLHAKKINYSYESPLEFDGVVKYPDFTIEDDDAGITYYWEHCGLLHDASYNRRWRTKEKWYRSKNILPIEEGGGSNGTLIVTRDKPNGGIDSQAISQIIQQVFSA
jgi:ATP-dependent exoDNAse (exonuclease V) alpha subunit